MSVIGLRPRRRGRPSAGKQLTAVERETLLGVRRGLSNKEIALARSVSINTVRTQLVSLLRKSGAPNRKALAKWRDPMDATRNTALACTFCGKDSEEAEFLIAGPDVLICGACVEMCNAIIARTKARRAREQ